MTQQVVGVDPEAVLRWLTQLGVEFSAPLQFQRIGLGQSNLTYRVSDSGGHAWVLRRPPLGHLLASAHDVLREARIIAALWDTDVPVPQILGTTSDPDFSDAPLVLMEFVDGLVVDTMGVAEALTPQHRHQIAVDLPATLTKIHAVDLAQVGLTDLASHKPYAQRQIKRWAGQWELSKTRELPELDDLTRRLASAAPEQREISLVHGDFHLRNLITDPDPGPGGGRVVATLDWELSTLGDPLADMGSLLTYWAEPGEAPPGDYAPSTLPGCPSRAEMTKLYLDETGRDPTALQYWHALGLWKLAIIAEGVMVRALNRPENKASAGTPDTSWIDARVRRASEIAAAAGI